jgi:hypothetical protein
VPALATRKRKAPEAEPRMSTRERKARLDSYAAAKMLATHFASVQCYPDEAVRAIRGEAPSVTRNPQTVTENAAVRVGGPRA